MPSASERSNGRLLLRAKAERWMADRDRYASDPAAAPTGPRLGTVGEQADMAEAVLELLEEVERYRVVLERIAGLPHISASAGRRADFLAREALGA